MQDEFQERSTTSFFGSLMDSVVGALFGVACFLGSFALLWWNEGNVIEEREAIQELSKYQKIDVTQPSAHANGKTIYGSGKLISDVLLGDDFLVPGPFVKLEREAEMYQWIEKKETEKKKDEKVTRYTYTKQWSADYSDSSGFKQVTGHENPVMTIHSDKLTAETTRYGAFNGAPIVELAENFEAIPLSKDHLKDASLTVKDNFFYRGAIAKGQAPEVGDVRIAYKGIKIGSVYSVLAMQENIGTLAAHVAKNGKAKILVESGTVPAEQMVQNAKDEANFVALILRALGWFLMFLGINLVLGPISAFLDFIPFLGSAGRFVIAVFSGAVSLVLSGITILVGMVAHKPILLGLVMAAAGGGIFYVVKRSKEQKRLAQQQQRGPVPQQNTNPRSSPGATGTNG